MIGIECAYPKEPTFKPGDHVYWNIKLLKRGKLYELQQELGYGPFIVELFETENNMEGWVYLISTNGERIFAIDPEDLSKEQPPEVARRFWYTDLMKPFRVLVVEDSRSWQTQWKERLEEEAPIILDSAYTIEEAFKKFAERSDWDAIVMDGCIGPLEEFNSRPLVHKIRETYHGPIIAASRSIDIRKALMTEGCTHEADKKFVPNVLFQILCRS